MTDATITNRGLARLYIWMTELPRRCATARALERLSDDVLRDIGIRREDIPLGTRKPVTAALRDAAPWTEADSTS